MNLEIVDFGTQEVLFERHNFSFMPQTGMKIVAEDSAYLVLNSHYDLDKNLALVSVVRDDT